MNPTVKRFILKIIPRQLIRAVKKKVSKDYFFFGASKMNIGEYIINESVSDTTIYYTDSSLGNEVSKGFEACYAEYLKRPLFLRKYLLNVKDCIVEPDYGWAIIQPGNKLIFDSISNNGWIENYHPSFSKYKAGRQNAKYLEEAVSINILKGGDMNYWHFIHDLLGQVCIALEHVPPGIPFLISKELSQREYFKEANKLSPILANISWIIRDDYYLVKKAWFIQTMPNSNEQFFNVRKLLQHKDSDKEINRRVFLIRSVKRIRYISNGDEIESIAKKYNFEIIDADKLTLPAQIKLFSETRWLVGIHGAGLSNIIFRKNALMNILELFPADYLQPHYFLLSKGMGHQYSHMVGSTSFIDTSFSLDTSVFEERIRSLLQQDSASLR